MPTRAERLAYVRILIGTLSHLISRGTWAPCRHPRWAEGTLHLIPGLVLLVPCHLCGQYREVNKPVEKDRTPW